MKSLTNKLHLQRRKLWTKLENQRLMLLFPKYPDLRLAREFDRTLHAITNQAYNFGLKKDVSKGYQPPLSNQKKWTDKETGFLLKHYKTMRFSEIADALGRTCYSVDTKAKRLGLKKDTLWTPKEEQRLRQLYSKHSLAELAKEFNRSVYLISLHAKKLGITGKEHPWSKDEIKYLIRNYRLVPADRLAEKLTRHPVNSIFHKARELGIRSGVYWTEKQKQYLKRWYHKKSLKELARHLSRGYGSIHHMLYVTGLKQKRFYR